MGDLEQAAHQQNVDRFDRDSRRLESAFGLAAGAEGYALIQRHLATLVDFVRQARAFGRPNRETYFMRSLKREVFDLVAGIPDEDLAQAMITGALDCTRVPPKKRHGMEVREKNPGRAAKEQIGAEIGRAARQYYLGNVGPTLLEQIERAAKYQPTRKKRLATERKILRKLRDDLAAMEPGKLRGRKKLAYDSAVAL